MITEGKWLISSSFLVVSEQAVIIANTQPIGIEGITTTYEESLANARLIAAAPDLLDALKEIKASEARCKKRGVGYDEHIHNMAEQAITKAEPQQADEPERTRIK